MGIEYSITLKNEILYVETKGVDDNLQQVEEYGRAIIEAGIKNNCAKVLCNETELEYRLGTLDTFFSAELISQIAPKIARVAIVCHPKYLQDGKFWETVAVNRGLEVRFFNDFIQAEKWLIQIK